MKQFALTFFIILYSLTTLRTSAIEETSRRAFANVKRTVDLPGFHRILKYFVIIPDVTGPTKLLIEETLPKDIYVDPYQLSDDIKKGKIIVSNSDINIEKPSYQSKPIDLKLCSYSDNNEHEINITIHMRYQMPHRCDEFGETVTVKLNTPLFYFKQNINNSIVEGCFDATDSHSWSQLKTEKMETKLTVPVGCAEQVFKVLYLTTGTIIIGSVIFIFVLTKIKDK